MLDKLRHNKQKLQCRQTHPPQLPHLLLQSLQVETCAESTMSQSYPCWLPCSTASLVDVAGHLTVTVSIIMMPCIIVLHALTNAPGAAVTRDLFEQLNVKSGMHDGPHMRSFSLPVSR